MPLTAEYSWVESETTVQLKVPLKGQSRSKLDVFATECYLKVSFPPYLLEVDLDGCIDSTQPKARVENGTLLIKARKKEGSVGLWGSLGQPVDRKCDPEVKARREESIKEKLKQEQELKERVSLRKHEDERLALRSQMSVDEDERRRIEDIKADQKEKAEAEVYRSFEELAAKQNREEPASKGKKVVPALTMAQPKKMGSSEQLQCKIIPPQLSSSNCSSRGRLRTIKEGESEEGSPIPPVMGSDATAATKLANESSIWEEGETGRNNGGNGEHNDYKKVRGSNSGSGNQPEDTQDELSPGASSGQEPKHQQQQQEEEDDGGNDAREETCNACCDGDGDEDETPMSYTPAPRMSVGVIPVGFTTRLFPTPLRESKVADESAWIMKNRSHLHKNKALVGRLPPKASGSSAGGGQNDLPFDVSETDPVWLKGRGDDLYRGGDFLGAVNAYTAALDANPKAAACLSNRAACHLRLSGSGSGDAHSHAAACVADCGAALEILQALPKTGPSQVRALARRALAYRELGHYRSSLEDCRSALLFSPGDATLLEEIGRGEPLARGEQFKKEAATRFASGDIAGACQLYTATLEAVPSFPSALSNRAACYLALGKPLDCVRDCTAVLEMLSVSVSSCSAGGPSYPSPSSSIPFCGGGGNGYNPAGSATSTNNGTVATTTTTTFCTTSEEKALQLPSSNAATTARDTSASSKPAVVAPSYSPPLPPPPVGSIPPRGSEKRTKWVLATVLRRARANVQLENFGGALRDYRMANSVSPGNKAVQADIRELEQRVSEAPRPLSSTGSGISTLGGATAVEGV